MSEDAITDEKSPVQEIYCAVTDGISARKQYDQRLGVMWDVRVNGISRKKEQAWQNDTPLKIADPAIDKIKPTLVQGIFTADVLATFAPIKAGSTKDHAKAAQQYFSDRVKRRTNFFRQFVIVIDLELQDGKAILKTLWNPGKNELEYAAVNSIYLIVPPGTEEIEDAEWICQVHPAVSKKAFKRMAKQKGWKLDKEDIAGLGGGGQLSRPQWADDAKRKQGLHYGDEESIVLWEYYAKNEDGEWEVTFLCPNKLDAVLDTQVMPYKHGESPFTAFDAELKDKDYHSPRGVVEKVLPEERTATLFRNLIGDYAMFASRPMYTTNGAPIANTSNLVAKPGIIFPQAITALATPPPPDILAAEMMQARQQGEMLGGAGDYLINQGQRPGKETRTATEIGVVAQQSGLQMDLRSRLNRDSLSKVFRQSWSLLCQYAGEDLQYLCEGEVNDLPKEALSDVYHIEPSGNPDGYSHGYQMQQAQMIYAQIKGDPAFDQDEAKRMLLESIDPTLVKRLFLGTKVAQKREAEDQGYAVLLLREGMPVEIYPGEDQAARAILTAQYIQRAVLGGEQMLPIGMQALQQHILQRLEILQKENPKAAAQLKQTLGQIAQQTAAQLQARPQPEPGQPNSQPTTTQATPPQSGAGVGPVGAIQ